jgi:hypothetical protein
MHTMLALLTAEAVMLGVIIGFWLCQWLTTGHL